uniref:NIDO domain-containing protein n=1 Tax=Scleropages formosus TaxID=113540 RepID=A0A8C9VVR3_SCLFO
VKIFFSLQYWIENFYPFGPNNGDTVNPAADDESSSVILLNETFQFFGSVHNQLYVNNYGFLTFDQPVSSSYSSMFGSGYDTIAPLWSYWNTTKSGVISYRQVTSGSDLQQATSDINQYFPQLNFTATWVFIATWDSVAYVYTADVCKLLQPSLGLGSDTRLLRSATTRKKVTNSFTLQEGGLLLPFLLDSSTSHTHTQNTTGFWTKTIAKFSTSSFPIEPCDILCYQDMSSQIFWSISQRYWALLG